MISLQQSVLILVALAAFVSSAYAISCYQCESGSNDGCGEKFNSELVRKVDCNVLRMPRFLQNVLPHQNGTGCMKTISNVAEGSTKKIVRTCFFGDPKVTAAGCEADPNIPHLVQLSCDVCTDNLCNGSSVTGPVALTIAMFALVARMVY